MYRSPTTKERVHTLLLFLLLWLPAPAISAQLNYGPVFGTQLSRFRGDGDSRIIRRYYGGAMVNFSVFRYGLSFQAEGLIAGAGSARRDIGPVTGYELRATYLSLPLQVKFRVRQRFHTGFGVQYAALIGATEKYTFSGRSRELDGSHYLRGGDSGVFFELGYQTLWGAGVHLRYYHGSHRVSLQDPAWYNSYIQCGLFFALGDKPERIRYRTR
jgi:hypothetical protein